LIELNNESFDLFIQQLQPGLVIFDRFMMEEQFGWRIEKQAPQAIRILNTEDLHSLRAVRQQMIKDYLNTQPEMTDLQKVPLHDMQILFDKMSASDLAKREIASLFRCDLTLMISEFEMALLQQQFQVPTRQLIYLPFLYEKIPTSPLTTFEERQNFIAIGNFRHEPNWDAVLWLKQEIWPQIRQQLPQAELHIYGAYPPKKATQLHNPQQGFKVMGWAENAFDVLSQSRVCLAPLRFGAGIKGKLAEAMLCGTPNVTTSIGSESMQIENSETWGGVIADQSHDFAEQAIRLYQDPALWQKAQNQGYAIVTDRYLQTPEKSRLLLDKIHELTTDLASHRTANFMGAMLNHHHHKSTQYMAQWIEAKNRLE
jgi:glycosyltransferase involved in cell wall biosynthesis|nr:glycosyltransferase family 4 protein [Thiomicrorhabdus sp.]